LGLSIKQVSSDQFMEADLAAMNAPGSDDAEAIQAEA